jgi:hypothetical protein
LNKTIIAVTFLFVATAAVSVHFHREFSRLAADMAELNNALVSLRAENSSLSEQVESVRANLDDVRVVTNSAHVCDTRFPSGTYHLRASTSYGRNISGEYSIYHASVPISERSINVGVRLNSYGAPTDFYFDYDGDGNVDTALAARLAREIPLAGNSLADRLLANSSISQALYSVFSCEWSEAEYTSADDMNNKMTGTAKMLWDLVQENSKNIIAWIRPNDGSSSAHSDRQ